MAVPKVMGIETEYGVVHANSGESNPVTASSMLINAYVNGYLCTRVGWDFEDEQPGVDARGFNEFDALEPDIETHLVNAVLNNGARFYVDHAHPELSTPECSDARQCALYDRAAEEVLVAAMAAAEELLPPGEQIVVHKNNSDGKGNSYGCHENYLIDREVPFGKVISGLLPFFVTRQIYCGAGKVGTELGRTDLGRTELAGDDAAVEFQLSQRADFFEEEVGLETTLKRPIINTRDEPHADPKRYRRLHVIVGDANMSETQTYLKVGTTAIVLAMIDDGQAPAELDLAHPVFALRQVSCDPSLTQQLTLGNGGTATAIDIQWQYLTAARKYQDHFGLEAVGEEVGADVLDRWEATLAQLERDPMQLADQLDWVAKLRLYQAFADRHGVALSSPKVRALDLQYHDLRPSHSLARRVGLTQMFSPDEVREAVGEPPETTRAYFRGKCLQHFGDQIVAANWDSMVFDVGTDALRRVPMMEPLKGTKTHVASVLDGCADAAELLRRLGN